MTEAAKNAVEADKVLLSSKDETKINRINSDGRICTWYMTSDTVPWKGICCVHLNSVVVHLWCGFGGKVGELRLITGIMRATDYIGLLEDSLIPSFDIFGMGVLNILALQNLGWQIT